MKRVITVSLLVLTAQGTQIERENLMELIECKTCGSHSFTDNKCDYCGNEYVVIEKPEEQEQLGATETMVIIDDYRYYQAPIEEKKPFFTKGQAILFWFLVSLLGSVLYFLALLFFMPLTIFITLVVIFLFTHRKKENN